MFYNNYKDLHIFVQEISAKKVALKKKTTPAMSFTLLHLFRGNTAVSQERPHTATLWYLMTSPNYICSGTFAFVLRQFKGK